MNLLPCDGSAVYHRDLFADLSVQQFVDTIPWQGGQATLFGRQYQIPRLQQWFGPQPYRYSGMQLPARPLPALVEALRHRVARAAGHEFNAALVNLYRDGNDCVGWHADDEPELGDEPVLASVSLGAARRFCLRHKKRRGRVDLVLEHGSLLVMSGPIQRHWHHALPRERDLGAPRVNLSFRTVY